MKALVVERDDLIRKNAKREKEFIALKVKGVTVDEGNSFYIV